MCAVATAALVACEIRASERGRRAIKPIASAAFVAVALARGAPGTSSYATWMLVGLGLGAAGDVALLGHDRRAIARGLALFGLGHLAYLVGLAALRPPDGSITAWAFVAVAASGAMAAHLWPYLGRLRTPVLAYVGLSAVVLAAALSVAGDGARGWRVAVGIALFFVSDIAVARQRFVRPALSNKLWGLPAYFAGQLLIAWSI